MRTERVEVFAPPFDQGFGFLHYVEDFPCKQLVSELGVEALAVSVLPRASRFNVERPDAKVGEPSTERLLYELRAVVGSNVIRRAMREEEISEDFEDDPRVEPAFNTDRQAFARILVDDAQHAEWFAVMGPIHHKVITPDMVAMLRPQSHAGAVIQP